MAANQFTKAAVAAAWATRNMSAQEWNNWCLKFAANAYGLPAAGYNTASEAAGAMGVGARPTYGFTAEQKQSILSKAQIGDLIFFDATYDNSAGHVGVYVGNGKMVSATPSGVREEDVLGTAYNSSRFRGVASPPKEWTGRAATEDIIEGAKKFQSVIESGRMESNLTRQLKETVESAKSKIEALQKEAKSLPISDKDAKVKGDAQLRLKAINDELKTLEPQLTKYKADLAASQDVDTKNAAKIPEGQTHKGADGSLWEKDPNTGQWVNTIPANSGAPQVTKAPDGSLIQYDPKTNKWDVIAEAPAKEPKTTWVDTGRELQLRDESGKLLQTVAKQQGVTYQQRPDGSLLQLDPTGQSAPKIVAQPTRTQTRVQEAEAEKAEALSGQERIRLTELQRQEAAGELEERNRAELDSLKARASAETAQAGFTSRNLAPGGPEEQAREAALAQTRATTPTEIEIKARETVASNKAAQANLETAYKEREKQVLDMVAKGTLTEAEGLTHLGKYAESLQAQLEARRQEEVERANRERERQAIEVENRNLAELAAEQISNAQGTAIFRNRGTTYGQSDRPATTFNPGGDPSQSPAQRVLAALGLAQRQAPAAPASAPTRPLPTLPARAPTITESVGTPVAMAPPAFTGQPYTPEFDYSAAGNAARYGIGVPQPPLSFFQGGI